MNIEEMFILKDPKNLNAIDLKVKSDDMLTKLLDFLEFWKQKKADRNATVFIIKSLYTIIKNRYDEDDIEPMIEAQNSLNRLNAT